MWPEKRNFITKQNNGVRLHLRAMPGATADEIAGIWKGAKDDTRLAVKVTAAPDKGKANVAIIKLLAKKLGLPKSALSVRAGETSRLKTIDIKGEPAVIAAALEKLAGVPS